MAPQANARTVVKREKAPDAPAPINASAPPVVASILLSVQQLQAKPKIKLEKSAAAMTAVARTTTTLPGVVSVGASGTVRWRGTLPPPSWPNRRWQEFAKIKKEKFEAAVAVADDEVEEIDDIHGDDDVDDAESDEYGPFAQEAPVQQTDGVQQKDAVQNGAVQQTGDVQQGDVVQKVAVQKADDVQQKDVSRKQADDLQQEDAAQKQTGDVQQNEPQNAPQPKLVGMVQKPVGRVQKRQPVRPRVAVVVKSKPLANLMKMVGPSRLATPRISDRLCGRRMLRSRSWSRRHQVYPSPTFPPRDPPSPDIYEGLEPSPSKAIGHEESEEVEDCLVEHHMPSNRAARPQTASCPNAPRPKPVGIWSHRMHRSRSRPDDMQQHRRSSRRPKPPPRPMRSRRRRSGSPSSRSSSRSRKRRCGRRS